MSVGARAATADGPLRAGGAAPARRRRAFASRADPMVQTRGPEVGHRKAAGAWRAWA
eukprot:CAMPEP_0185377704 /NCGR_PEP_ID=MMETSP1364-20130426/42920_1 /TAXON_ID=38817 /ORGANISM="Gephyrocapsa oceanica, Strain RCC1303" /LENGTH=56 /DNA_ID=CAMNT_0027979189 /DNA_START=31 /DNA_END=201 /DNA_ORIENTATION=-